MTSPKGKGDDTRINQMINAPRIRVIDANGDMLGVLPVNEAIRKAEIAGLDLVEIVPNAEPPVCKIMDYGKYRYEAQKKQHEARKKQKIIQTKEVKLRPTIGEHDLEIKLRNTMGWLEEGDKVKFSLKFRGREMAHQDIGMALIRKIEEKMQDKCKVEVAPRFEGNQIIFLIGPK